MTEMKLLEYKGLSMESLLKVCLYAGWSRILPPNIIPMELTDEEQKELNKMREESR